MLKSLPVTVVPFNMSDADTVKLFVTISIGFHALLDLIKFDNVDNLPKA